VIEAAAQAALPLVDIFSLYELNQNFVPTMVDNQLLVKSRLNVLILARCKTLTASANTTVRYTLTMAITNESRDKLKARLSKAIGHLNAVYKMVDEQKYCIDILNQLKAVQSALDKSAEIMLKDHLNTCVVEAVQNNDSARVMEELWQLLRHSSEVDSTETVSTKTDCCGT